MLSYIAYLQALRLEKNKKWESALAAYQEIAKIQNKPSAKLAYRIGFVAEKIKDWEIAETWLQRAVEADPTKAQWHYRLALAQELNKKFSLAAETYGQAVALQPKNPQYLYRLGKVLWICGKGEEAEAALHKAIELAPNNPSYAYELAVAIRKQGRIWQEVEALQAALALDTGNAQWHFELGEALEKMGRFAEAAEAFTSANKKQPDDAGGYYRAGYAWQQAGKTQQSEQAFAKAIAHDITLNASCLGIGTFHQQRGLWPQAVAAYQQSLNTQPENAELHYRLGLAHERCYQWPHAEQYYRQALALENRHAHWHYRLGFVLERLQQPEQAIQAYQAAIARNNSINPQWYARLGQLLLQLGHHTLAATTFAASQPFHQPHGLDTRRYQKLSFAQLAAQYVDNLQSLPLLEHCILYESQAGKSINCNPLALFQQLQNDPRFTGFTHVWVVTKDTPIREFAPGENDTTILYVTRGSKLYLQYLAQAKYLINNNTFPPYFVRRQGQQYLNTWHGTPLKTLGRKIKGGFMEHANATRNFLQATHILSPNRHTSRVLLEDYEVQGLFTGKLAETGYPRIDQTINPATARCVRRSLGLDSAGEQTEKPLEKIVLYAPTWRGTLQDVQLDADQLLGDLKAMQQPGVRLLFRGHHMQEAQLRELELPELNVTVVPEHIDTNALLAAVDILITDYSSIFFDYLPLGRPVIYYAYDLEAYQQERGLNLDMASLPGDLCQTRKQLQSCLQAHLHQPQLKGEQPQAQEQFYPHEDGQASQRAIEFFFFGDDSYNYQPAADSRKKLLFYQGNFIPNGITSSFLSLLAHLDSRQYDISVVIDPNAIANFADRLERLGQLPPHVRILPRIGHTLLSIEERWIDEQFSRIGSFTSPEQELIHAAAYQREYRRLFGEVHFDAVINFEGYVRFWVYTFATAPNSHKIIYLHSDMRKEQEERFPYLKNIFLYYHHYHRLACVSPSVTAENRIKLATHYGIQERAFVSVNNLIDAPAIIEKSKQPFPHTLQTWLEGAAGTIFVTLGRLSPEKDHAKLIHAFHQVVQQHSQARLIILGQGPLYQPLHQQIHQLGLHQHILLAGLHANPFPVLARADCFVFSSNYEGQGLVILEALVLGRPVISTDVVGPRGLLAQGEGVLVSNHADALAQAMLAFIQHGQSPSSFDPQIYTANALTSFTHLLT